MKQVRCIIHDDIHHELKKCQIEYDVTIREIVEYCIVNGLENYKNEMNKKKMS